MMTCRTLLTLILGIVIIGFAIAISFVNWLDRFHYDQLASKTQEVVAFAERYRAVHGRFPDCQTVRDSLAHQFRGIPFETTDPHLEYGTVKVDSIVNVRTTFTSFIKYWSQGSWINIAAYDNGGKLFSSYRIVNEGQLMDDLKMVETEIRNFRDFKKGTTLELPC